MVKYNFNRGSMLRSEEVKRLEGLIAHEENMIQKHEDMHPPERAAWLNVPYKASLQILKHELNEIKPREEEVCKAQ